ncbi:unnamed protein product [Vicia faba]|uniref:Coatomer subunit zeta n=1 Tax=Vicia faba TaxID=3906 RepID=A0AAV1ALD1_VICFA|nr:unnamed protein product [Vicia faba]
MASNSLCPPVKNILLLDSEGKRVTTVKTNARTEAEITLLENNIIVYKFVQDLHFFVTGGDDENELWHQFFRRIRGCVEFEKRKVIVSSFLSEAKRKETVINAAVTPVAERAEKGSGATRGRKKNL